MSDPTVLKLGIDRKTGRVDVIVDGFERKIVYGLVGLLHDQEQFLKPFILCTTKSLTDVSKKHLEYIKNDISFHLHEQGEEFLFEWSGGMQDFIIFLSFLLNNHHSLRAFFKTAIVDFLVECVENDKAIIGDEKIADLLSSITKN